MASSTPRDPEDSTLKRRARRRLLGSIALVLVAVIALPMVFDDEKKPLDQDVSVQIPNQEPMVVRPSDPKGAKGKTVEPREPKVGPLEAPPDAATGANKGAQKVPAGTDAKGEGKAVARTDDKTGSRQEAKPDARAEDKPEPKPVARAETRSEAKGEPKPALSKSEEARVKSILDGAIAKEAAGRDAAAKDVAKDTAKDTAKDAVKDAANGFAVQIGAFATEDKIREAREKLGGAGFKSYTEKLDTKEGERTRVRAGPFASRDAAEAARDKIRALGYAGAAVVAR